LFDYLLIFIFFNCFLLDRFFIFVGYSLLVVLYFVLIPSYTMFVCTFSIDSYAFNFCLLIDCYVLSTSYWLL